jgi:hypothetical protein
METLLEWGFLWLVMLGQSFRRRRMEVLSHPLLVVGMGHVILP